MNTATCKYKAINVYNTNDKQEKIILFDENNTKIHSIEQNTRTYHLSMSSDGNSLLNSFVSHSLPRWRFNLYDISNKKEPKLLKIFASHYCWFSQKENIFCDQKNLYNAKGDKKETLTEDKDERVIGFSQDHFALRKKRGQ